MNFTKLLMDAIPTGKQKMLASFNKITGEFIALAQPEEDMSKLNHDYYVYTEVEIDLDTQRLIGTYDNFKIEDLQNIPVTMYESAIDNAAQAKIDNMYGIYKRLEVQEQLLEKLSAALNVEDEQFLEMRDYINEVKANNKLYKEHLVNSPDTVMVTLQEQEEIFEKQMEGGLHEAVGDMPTLTPKLMDTPAV